MTELSFTAAVHATVKGEAKARGISLRDVSIRAGLGPETIRGYINRKRPMNTDVMEAAAVGLGMEFDDFMDIVMLRIHQSRKVDRSGHS